MGGREAKSIFQAYPREAGDPSLEASSLPLHQPPVPPAKWHTKIDRNLKNGAHAQGEKVRVSGMAATSHLSDIQQSCLHQRA
jgi:hypothetical protein